MVLPWSELKGSPRRWARRWAGSHRPAADHEEGQTVPVVGGPQVCFPVPLGRVEPGPMDLVECYLREAGPPVFLVPEEEQRLARLAQAGDAQAREELIRAHLRLVVAIARDFTGLGLELADLIGEGNLGLLKAADRFNPERQVRFATWAAIWIRQAIRRALSNRGRVVRLPVSAADRLCWLRRAEARLEACLGRPPTEDELAQELGIRAATLRRWQRVVQRPISLETPVNGHPTPTVGDVLEDQALAAPDMACQIKERSGWIHHSLTSLEPRERAILESYFGLNGGEPESLQAAGTRLGLSRQRVHQLQRQALQTLRRRFLEWENGG